MATVPAAAGGQEPWRFGLEHWRTAQLCDPTEPDGAPALDKSAALLSGQVRPNMNINWARCGFWEEMQPVEDGPIDFSVTDAWVGELQSRGLNLHWTLRLGSSFWANDNDPACFAGDTAGGGPCEELRAIDGDCAPDSPEHEQDFYDYVFAVVERYDADGVGDMPGLLAPLEFFQMEGEARMFWDCGGHGSGYWWSDVDALLRTNRIAYRAVHDADERGVAKLICAGGIAATLYEDFPDWPAHDGPTVMARLASSWRGETYTAGWADLLAMYRSYGDDGDGVECDYVGWHPHSGWRGIDQSFRLIRTEMTRRPGSHTLPIYVDDMWVNMRPSRADPEPMSLFTSQDASTLGDFPNSLVASLPELLAGLQDGDPAVVGWYEARQARQIPKNFATAFALGAERVFLSWMSDDLLTRAFAPGVGWQGVLDTALTGFTEKPGYFTYRLLIDTLYDFSAAREIGVGSNPRTRCVRFDRPTRSDVIICWSETGPPPDDYSAPNGEEVRLAVCVDEVEIVHPITERGDVSPTSEVVPTASGVLDVRLGHEPIIIDGVAADECTPDAGPPPDGGEAGDGGDEGGGGEDSPPEHAGDGGDAEADADGAIGGNGAPPGGCECRAAGGIGPTPAGGTLPLGLLLLGRLARRRAGGRRGRPGVGTAARSRWALAGPNFRHTPWGQGRTWTR